MSNHIVIMKHTLTCWRNDELFTEPKINIYNFTISLCAQHKSGLNKFSEQVYKLYIDELCRPSTWYVQTTL